MQWLSPDWPDAPDNIGALTTLRGGGVSAMPYGDGQGGGGLNLGLHVGDQAPLVMQNRRLLQAVLPGQPAWLTQVHGTAVLEVVDAGGLTGGLAGGLAGGMAGAWSENQAPRADASFSSARRAVCAILTADCLPVLLCDAEGRVVAGAHAGWRGLAAGVLSRTVAAMRAGGAGEILAWLGPAIGPRRFEVGAEVRQAFLDGAPDVACAQQILAAFAPIVSPSGPVLEHKYLADIYALARAMLRRDGVQRISGGQFCTVSEPLRFYSYRRDAVTGRQASLIWRK